MTELINVSYDTLIPNNVGLSRPARAEGAGEVASRLHQLVERPDPATVPEEPRLSAHGGQRRSQGLGEVRLREDAGISLGRAAGAAGRGPQDSLRRTCRRAGLAGSARRISRHAAPPDRHPGRHRAGVGRAAALPRHHRAFALRYAQPVPGQCRGGPPSLGDGLSAAQIFRRRRPRRGRRSAAPPAPARRRRRACSAPSTRRRRTGCRSSCSPTSPTATARCSSRASRNPASIRCRAPAASC